MNAYELADELDNMLKAIGLTDNRVPTMLRQQQAEIEFLKKEILAKHEDWKHEGQQAANAKAENEALKAEIEELKLAKKVILRYAEKDIAKYRAEVEELKKQLALWKLSKSSEEIEQVGTNPTSVGGLDELVAWIDKNTGKPRMEGFVQTDYDIPLYTHPSKDLTDEEIEAFAYAFELWQMNNPDKVLEGIIDFARALLEKAQEK